MIGGERIGPTPPARPGLVFGGHSDAMIRRTVRWGDGWTGSTGGPARNEPVSRRIRDAWAEAGRAGDPRFVALVYFGLGEGSEGSESESDAPSPSPRVSRFPAKAPSVVTDFASSASGTSGARITLLCKPIRSVAPATTDRLINESNEE